MSPEQSSCGTIDSRSDIYSLGCVVFEMLAGTPPFTGPTPLSVRARHAADPPPSLRTVRNTVSPALEQAIDKALAKVPADRFQSAAAFAGQWRQVQLEQPQLARSAAYPIRGSSCSAARTSPQKTRMSERM
ncbi:MAG: protein kinase domain-containing protein [Gemmatimonadales bacterium]